MKSLIHFITYNNAVPLALGILFLGAGGALAASPEIRHAVYATTEIVRVVDNTQLLATNIDAYRFNVKVNSVNEDDTNYYVDYSYITLAVSDGVWRDSPKSNRMKISKKSMTGRDLGLYVTEQIGQVINQETTDLKQVQRAEKTKGVTPKVVAVEYSGLVGRMFDTKEKTFPGYVPVVVPVVPAPPEVAVVSQASEMAAVAATDAQVYSQTPVAPPLPVAPSPQDIRTMIDEAIKAYLATKAAETVAPTTPVPDVPSPSVTPPPTATSIEELSPSPTPPLELPIEQPLPLPSDVPVDEQPAPPLIDTPPELPPPIEPPVTDIPLPLTDTASSTDATAQ